VRLFYNIFFRLLPIRKVNSDHQLFLLNDDEIKAIRRKERFAVWCAAFFGAMGVLLLYVPQYLLPKWFPLTKVCAFDKCFDLPLIMILYSVVLVVIEIMLLTFLNIWCAHEIAVATGFLDRDSKRREDKRRLLIDIGTEKKDKELLQYGIDPLQGLNRKALLVWNLLLMLKATLSNLVFKIFIQRVLGRYAVKALQDFAGIPIFAWWNAWGTKKVLHETRVVIMGQNLVEVLSSRIRSDQEPTEAFKQLLYDTLQYIAISKRDFHRNHCILTRNLFAVYKIEPQQHHWLEAGYYENLRQAGKEQREVCQLLIAVGFLLDGKLSYREKKQLQELNKEGLLDIDYDTLKTYQRAFLDGKGIDSLIAKYL
jgi:hypothetical protein